MKPVSVIIDDRERAGGLVDAVYSKLFHAVKIQRLKVGDVFINNHYLIERKTSSDFVASMIDGRLTRQIQLLVSQKNVISVMILEGIFDARALGGMSIEQVWQTLLDIQLDKKLTLITSTTLQETAQWILTLARRDIWKASKSFEIETELSSPVSAPTMHRNAHRPRSNYAQGALSRIEGIGLARAKALLNHFGSIQGVASASVEDLTQVPGIGKDAAISIFNTFHSKSGKIEKDTYGHP